MGFMTGPALLGALRGRRASHGPALEAACALQPLRVRNEFGALRAALVHDASNAIDTTMEDLRRFIPPDELAEHPESGPSFRARIIAQHAAFRRLLEEHGVALISPQTQEGAFCQVFARQCAERLKTGGKAMIRPRARGRIKRFGWHAHVVGAAEGQRLTPMRTRAFSTSWRTRASLSARRPWRVSRTGWVTALMRDRL